MSDRIALILALLILGAVLADLTLVHSGVTMFLARKLYQFVDYLAFWR